MPGSPWGKSLFVALGLVKFESVQPTRPVQSGTPIPRELVAIHHPSAFHARMIFPPTAIATPDPTILSRLGIRAGGLGIIAGTQLRAHNAHQEYRNQDRL